MKSRCCSCGYVFVNHKSCVKCGSNALESLVPKSQSKQENKSSAGPQLLTEVPDRKANLLG